MSIFTKHGNHIHLKSDGSIKITGDIDHDGNTEHGGNVDVSGTMEAGEVASLGDVEDSSTSTPTMQDMRDLFNTHTHSGGGNPPIQQM